VFLHADRLEDSGNCKLAHTGLAYPTYYTGLYYDLRQKLTSAVEQARQAGGKGIWVRDSTNSGFIVFSLASVTDEEIILPKLLRRMEVVGQQLRLTIEPEKLVFIEN